MNTAALGTAVAEILSGKHPVHVENRLVRQAYLEAADPGVAVAQPAARSIRHEVSARPVARAAVEGDDAPPVTRTVKGRGFNEPKMEPTRKKARRKSKQ